MNLRLKNAFAILCFFTVVSCSDKKNKTLFELVQNSGIDFTNQVDDSKDFNIFSYRNFYNGGGVAIGDINRPTVLLSEGHTLLLLEPTVKFRTPAVISAGEIE